MKFFLTISLIISMVVFTANESFAQKQKSKVVTTSIEVSGVCGMCKRRIEKAALIKGVKLAEWDAETQQLKLIYKPDQVSELKVQESIAEAGHDTEKVKATEKNYLKLPQCCAYRDGVKVH